jgi:hypothetical protein
MASWLTLYLSLNLLLSIVKEESFDLRNARIQTRDLEYRNQTWSVSVCFWLLLIVCLINPGSLKS